MARSVAVAAVFVLVTMIGVGNQASATDTSSSSDLFAKIASVLTHPRCMNCHTLTDFPRQGNERRPHDFLVSRGSDGHGAAGLHCATCHQTMNQVNGVPGAPNWHLAPLSMGWERLTTPQLCQHVLDRKRNGNRDLAALREHLTQDKLVAWGWTPGANREPVPVSRDDFVKLVDEWLDAGAPCPR